jgi:methionyl-tRNA formyltransferase
MTLRLAFMGTPDFAAASLAEIVGAGHEVVRVYSQPPRPSGRGQALRKSPVHQLAEQFGIEVLTPASFRDPDVIADFAALDLDAACVVAYGQILPQEALGAPRLGCLNLHASLLPRWRGAAPIQRAIMAGDEVTGVQIMQMEAGLDTGPVLISEIVPIAPEDTAGSLHDRLMTTGAQLWPRTLAALERGSLNATPQPEQGVTYAKKITAAEARIDWTRPAGEVADHIRGLSPFPGAWFELEGAKRPVRVKVHFAEPEKWQGERCA